MDFLRHGDEKEFERIYLAEIEPADQLGETLLDPGSVIADRFVRHFHSPSANSNKKASPACRWFPAAILQFIVASAIFFRLQRAQQGFFAHFRFRLACLNCKNFAVLFSLFLR